MKYPVEMLSSEVFEKYVPSPNFINPQEEFEK